MKRSLKILITICFVIIAFFIFSTTVHAEGSRDLYDYDSTEDQYRAFFEDFETYTYKIPRKSTIKVYAEKGEIIKYGTSVYDSHDENDNPIKDVKITSPSGVVAEGDVLKTGEGYIDTWEKEKNGPYPEKGGYTPLIYEVKETGIYTIVLQSYAEEAVNPKATLVKGDFVKSQNTTIGAWDVTVEKKGKEVKGRVFADYISLNTGNNNIKSYFDFYVLTQDGYLYNVDMKGIDPYGCIIFGNNRGCIDTKTDTPLYHTIVAENTTMTRLAGDVAIPLPQNGDSELDIFHKIFFNEPASDLPDTIPTKPLPEPVAKNLKFNGNLEENVGSEKSIGTFSFEVDRLCTYDFKIVDADNNVIRNYRNTAIKGLNTISWDGKDTNGAYVSHGAYKAVLTLKSGEYHFPMLDVETLHGMTISLINSGFKSHILYYDNSSYTINKKTINLETDPSGHSGVTNDGITDPVKTPESGIDSLLNPLKFGTNYGNQKSLDVWTYTKTKDTEKGFIILENTEDLKLVTLSGFVFFDKDKNGNYDVTSGDYGMKGVTINITHENGSTHSIVTDQNGKFIQAIPAGMYTIDIVGKEDYEITTDNDHQEIEVIEDTRMEDVGYYKEYNISTSIVLGKDTYNLDDEENEQEITVGIQNTLKNSVTNVVSRTVIPNNFEVKSFVIDDIEIPLADMEIIYPNITTTISESNSIIEWKLPEFAKLDNKQITIKGTVKTDSFDKYTYFSVNTKVACDQTETVKTDNDAYQSYEIFVKSYWIKTRCGVGGTVSGQGSDIYEEVTVGADSVEDIVVTPKKGYVVKSIKITYIDDDNNEIENEELVDGILKEAITLQKFESVQSNVLIEVTFDENVQPISVAKRWNDNSDVAGKRPDSIVISVVRDDEELGNYSITEDDKWSIKITDFPKYDDDGNILSYSVYEKSTNSIFYKNTGCEYKNDKWTITNKFVVPDEYVNVETIKIWNDNNDEAQKRPDTLEVELYKNGTKSGNKLQLNSSNEWKGTFSSLKKYDSNGDIIEYTVEENFETDFYRKEKAEELVDDNKIITLTNTFEVPDEEIHFDVVKVWNDNDNVAGQRPEEIQIELYQNGIATGNIVTLTANENWGYTYEHLNRYDSQGNEIVYSVKEIFNSKFYENAVYNNEKNKTTITNNFRVPNEKVSISIEKIWDDDDNIAQKRPSSITVNVCTSGDKVVESCILNTDNEWKYTFTNLRKYNENGIEINYNVVEDFDDENYDNPKYEITNNENFTLVKITNSFIHFEEKTDVIVNKIWDDNNDYANKRPAEISVNLKNGDTIVGTAILSEGKWSHTFKDLPKFDENNNKIEYSAEETKTYEFYQIESISKNENVINITNKFTVPDDVITLKVSKIWDDKNNQYRTRPDNISVDVKNGDEVVKTVSLTGSSTSNDGWEQIIENLPKYNENADIITYTVDETDNLEEYTKEVNGTTITNTFKSKDATIVKSMITKDGTNNITSKNSLVDYKISYTASVDKYFGGATVTIIDELPYEINTDESNLDGGTYSEEDKTITWIEHVNVENQEEICYEKNISVKYLNVDYAQESIRNIVSGKIVLDKIDIKECVSSEKISWFFLKGKVITEYYLNDKNETLYQSDSKIYDLDTKYETKPIEIDYYEIDQENLPNNLEGTTTEEDIFVKYFYNRLPFNLMLKKEIFKARLNGEEITELLKDEGLVLEATDIENTEFEITYRIEITNTEEIEGYATIEETIPNGFKFVEESSDPGWTIEDDKYRYTTENITPGESNEVYVTLKWIPSEKKDGTIKSLSKIIETVNNANFDETITKDNDDFAEIQIKILRDDIDYENQDEEKNNTEKNEIVDSIEPDDSEIKNNEVINDIENENINNTIKTGDEIYYYDCLLGIAVFVLVVIKYKKMIHKGQHSK